MPKQIKEFKFFIACLSMALFLLFPFQAFSYVIKSTDTSTHYRIEAERVNSKVDISRIGKKVIFKGKNKKVLNDLHSWFRKNKFSKKYIKSVSLNTQGDLQLEVAASNIEVFSFIRRGDKDLVIDFWENVEVVKNNKRKDVVKVKSSAPKKKKINSVKNKAVNKKVKKIKRNDYKDFRYGLSFIWDYAPIFPKSVKFVEITRKTPLVFYSLKDRDYEKSEKEAHMQLSINLFRKDKWGLMNKSVDLYNKKYGADFNEALNEYLRIVALIKNDYLNGDTKPKKEVIKRLEELEKISDEFLLSKSILKYVFQYYVNTEDHISALKIGKKLFVLTKEDYDTEGLVESLHGIIYSLSKLNQYDKISYLLEDKEVEKYLDKISIAEYKIFNSLKNKDYEQVLREYNSVKKSIVGKVPASILFNVGEAYFSNGNYESASKYFDRFLSSYSFSRNSSKARMRIALCYDFLNKDEKAISRLYKDVIDRSADSVVRYEASLRYFGFEYLRNTKNKNKDLAVFIEPPSDIKDSLDKNLIEAKWQMRLRKFIVDGDYEKAITYLKEIPFNDLLPEKRGVFRKDGAAALSYEMAKMLKDEKYTELIQLHEKINKKYSDANTYFFRRYELLGMAYSKMNINSSYNKVMKIVKNKKNYEHDTYPHWKKEAFTRSRDVTLLKLAYMNNLKKKNEEVTLGICEKLKKIDELEGMFCKAKTNFSFKKLDAAKREFEKIISNFNNEIDGTELNKEISYLYLMTLYHKRLYSRFYEIVRSIEKENAYIGMHNKLSEEIKYLYYETVYSNPKLVIDSEVVESMNQFSTLYPNSKWLDRVRYLRGSSLIKMGKFKQGKKALDDLIGLTQKEYIKDLARSELASLILNNKKI